MNYTPTKDTSHTCPGGCGRTVARHLFACRACWRRLPMLYQTPILTAYWAGDIAAHSRAMTDAMSWYAVDNDSRAAQVMREVLR
jgi:hypothetical protein